MVQLKLTRSDRVGPRRLNACPTLGCGICRLLIGCFEMLMWPDRGPATDPPNVMLLRLRTPDTSGNISNGNSGSNTRRWCSR